MMIHRKESLILTTIEVIDQLGIQGFTTKEVAKRQGVSEGTLFRHFSTKNDLLMGVLDYYSKFDEDIIESTQLKGLSPIDAIIYFVKAYAEYYENYPAITSIAQSYDILTCAPNLKERIISIFSKRTNFIKSLIEEAKAQGDILPAVNSEHLAYIINGLRREICLKWRLNKYDFSLKEETLSALKMILSALSI